MRRIGLLGGTFDPVHRGHIQLARAAMKEASLDKVVMIPAADPPHKDYSGITPFHHRMEMLKLAVADEEHIDLSGIEGELPRPSFTVDTVQQLQKEADGDTLFCFIIGIDAFVEILSWKSCYKLLGMVTLLVARRRGFEDASGLETVRTALGYTRCGDIWTSDSKSLQDIQFLQADINELSSSGVRTLLAEPNSDVSGLAGEVKEYIRKNKLYAAGSVQ